MPESSSPGRSTPTSDLGKHMTLVVGSDGKPMGYPLRIINAQDTATLMMLGRVTEAARSPHVIRRGNRDPFPLPSVIKLKRDINSLHNILTGRTVRFSRNNLFLRDQGVCQYTGEKLSWYHDDPRKRATFDHIIPRCEGSEATWPNAVLASEWANNTIKGSKSLLQARIWPQRNPWIPTEQDMLSLAVQQWLNNSLVPKDWLPYLKLITPTIKVQRLNDKPIKLDYTPLQSILEAA
ncbi:MAG: HNH endonuclease [Alphaproteobacteria bacterium]|nr:MAG: HNH endonuclease [Alphaproteobacteria bacterium]